MALIVWTEWTEYYLDDEEPYLWNGYCAAYKNFEGRIWNIVRLSPSSQYMLVWRGAKVAVFRDLHSAQGLATVITEEIIDAIERDQA